MTGENDIFLPALRVYVCPTCGLELALTMNLNTTSIEDWAVLGNTEEDPSESQITKRKIIIPKFKVGDRIYDHTTETSGLITKKLPDGVYLCLPDGVTEEVPVKEKDIVFDFDVDAPLTEEFLRERCRVGAYVELHIITSSLDQDAVGMLGSIIDISGDTLTVEINEHRKMRICPDADSFVMLIEEEIQPPQN